MLTKQIKETIYEFVKDEPKTIQEIAQKISSSWVTAQRYIDKLSEEGIIGSKTFRGGTKGALRIVYTKP